MSLCDKIPTVSRTFLRAGFSGNSSVEEHCYIDLSPIQCQAQVDDGLLQSSRKRKSLLGRLISIENDMRDMGHGTRNSQGYKTRRDLLNDRPCLSRA
jgi:hypothetical protein